jgi:hypothetical protein
MHQFRRLATGLGQQLFDFLLGDYDLLRFSTRPQSVETPDGGIDPQAQID